MNWSEINLGGKPAELLLPEGPVEWVLVFLHGYDNVTLRNQPAYHEALERHHAASVCPLGPGCWWTTTIHSPFDPTQSPIDFLRSTLTQELAERFPNVENPVGIFGFEMGGQGALQAAYRSPRTFPNVAGISPIVDFESWYGHGTTLDELFPDREAARQQIATLQLNPLNWPRRQLLLCDPGDRYCLEGVQTLASKLSSSGVPFEQDFETPCGGFGWDYVNAMADRVVAFLTTVPDSSH